MPQFVTTPLPEPACSYAVNASQAQTGAPITPLQRLQIMSADEWEQFILEWVDSLRVTYKDVQRCGGKGDMGRDVVAFKAPIGPKAPWDNYQCKHYAKGLSIPDAVSELGKLLYYASQGDFVTPRGPGTELFKCWQKGTLRQELMTRWNTQCRTKITKTGQVELADMQATIDAFDFSTVTILAPLHVIAGHQATKYYTFRFGGGLPARTLPVLPPPAAFQPGETVYVQKLFAAYDDEKNTAFTSVDELATKAPPLAKHLQRSREQFFSAESLRAFSRDNVPTGTFQQLQGEVFDGVQEVYEDETHASGYQRVVKTVQKARDIAITGNPLIGVIQTNDRAGICHQLANDDRLTWVKDKPDNQPEEKQR